jgi:CRP-like cAMP-binding protein
MTNSERLDVLRAAKELTGRTDTQMRRLLPFIDEVTVPPGTVIAEAGRLCHQLVIVASGMLETCRNGRSGRLGTGDVFGWNAMRERGAYDATVQSISPARLLVMSHQQFGAVVVLPR